MDNIMIRIIMVTLLILNGCSMLPPSAKDYQNKLSSELGKNINSDYFYGTKFYKTQRKNNKKYYYDKTYNYSTKAECRVLYITDLNDIIVEYKILTPNTCKIGTSAVW
ncbi:hypothetical protein MN086_01160 [Sulfurovum sp. XGS-02]|uniref:hypothetical protein n=1 Tax=Sulfurovum sp. XGS-02 TaxID=2925411 RepID=UPI00206AC56B|nr:hypothetical protein [Sulfurovum sp. XGS-02]UPT77768.1 hypothetical protein MN086_01160 [Sulfurovum sp. XGS-02]